MKTNILLFIAGALLRVILEAVGSIGRKIDWEGFEMLKINEYATIEKSN